MRFLPSLATYFGVWLLITTPVIGYDIKLPDEAGVQVISSTWSGTGCPDDTVAAKATGPKLNFRTMSSPNGDPPNYVEYEVPYSDILIGFAAYNVSIGPGIAPAETRKDCTLRLELAPPTGWQFGVDTVVFLNGVTMGKGIHYLVSALASFNTEDWGPSVTFTTWDFGMDEGTYNFASSMDVAYMDEELLYSRCGAENVTLKVKIEAWMTSDVKESYGTNFAPEAWPTSDHWLFPHVIETGKTNFKPEEGLFGMDLGLRWKEC